MISYKEVIEQLEKERQEQASIGMRIAYGIDHFNLTVEELALYSKQTGVEPDGIVEIMSSYEHNGHDVDECKKFLADYSQEQEQLSLEERKKEYLKLSCAGYREEFNRKRESFKDRRFIKSGFATIDKLLDGGIHPGVYLIGAVPSLGKTTLVMQMVDAIASQGQDVLVFSLEMSKFDLMAKSISRLTWINARKARKDPSFVKTARGVSDGRRFEYYTDEEKELIASAEDKYFSVAEHVFIIEGCADIGTAEIRERVKEHIEMTGNVPYVVVDYVQILAPFDVRASDKQNVDRNAEALMRLRTEFNTAVFGVSSFSRAAYRYGVSMASFKESGALEYGADVMLGLQFEGVGAEDFDADEAKRQNPRRIEAVILKNRFGVPGDTVEFLYYPAENVFIDRGVKNGGSYQ